MAEKDHIEEYGATTAIVWLVKEYNGSGRVVIADSWFGSVKSIIAEIGIILNNASENCA